MKLKLIALIAGFLLAMSGAVIAQDQDAPYDSQNQAADSGPDTSSSVARISLIHGDVSTQRGDSGDWQAAALNSPVVAGDRVSTGDRSRAELQLDYANILRLDEHAQASINALDRNTIQVQLGNGRANYTVLRDSNANVEIDTPNVAVHPDHHDGSYAIYVSGDGHTEVVVRRGSADIATPSGSTRVDSGQMITVEGTGDQTQYKISGAPGRDDFDKWASDRNQRVQNAQSWHHTNNYYTGSEDLDAYGHWKDVPDYGSVWVPTVGAGWAPYREGQWVWEPGWGWTWVSYEPWGWAPYHYGRWMYVDGGWGWWPGPVYSNPYYYPVWAPAYVSFFGFGSGWGVGFGFGGGWGSIGWLPIGPCDHFYPWWGGYRNRFNTVNITNINITNININNRNGGWGALHGGTMYSNVRHAVNDPGFRHAISTVPSNQFGHGRVVARPVSGEMFRNAHLVNGNLPVVPTRQSLSASGRPAARSTMSNRMDNQRFFSNSRTPALTRGSFAQEQARVQNNIRQNSRFTPINGSQVGGGRTMANEGDRIGARQGMNTAPRQGMNSSPAQPSRGPELGRPGSVAGNNNGANAGWRRFGGPAGQPTAQNESQPRTFGSRAPETTQRGGSSPWKPAPRPGNRNEQVAPAPRPTPNNSGWRQSTPMPSRSISAEPVNRGSQNESWRNATPRNSAPEPVNRGSQNQSWRNATPRNSAPESRNYGRGSENYSRPPLNMRQPIVTPRGGDYSRPSYGGNRGSYSAPSPRSYSPPSYSAPSPSRGGYSAPSPGRGGYSAPSPSRGGYSAPSRGGSSGGGSHSSGSSSRSSNNNSGHRGR